MHWLGCLTLVHMLARIGPTRIESANRIGHCWLWTMPFWQRSVYHSTPPTFTSYILSSLHTWMMLPQDYVASPKSSFDYGPQLLATTKWSVHPSWGPSSSWYSRGCPAGLPTYFISGCPNLSKPQQPNQTSGNPCHIMQLGDQIGFFLKNVSFPYVSNLKCQIATLLISGPSFVFLLFLMLCPM